MSIRLAKYGGGKIPSYNILRQADRRTQLFEIKTNCSESSRVERGRTQRRWACLFPVPLCSPKMHYVKLFGLDFFFCAKIYIFGKSELLLN